MYIQKKVIDPWTEIWKAQLVGSSFKSTDGKSRQSALRHAYKKQDAFYDDIDNCEDVTVDIERYDYNGNPAYLVFFDDREVGNLPAEFSAELAKAEDNGYAVFGDSCEIYGGPTDFDPDYKYGASIWVKVRRKPTEAEIQAEKRNAAKSIPPATVAPILSPSQPAPEVSKAPDVLVRENDAAPVAPPAHPASDRPVRRPWFLKCAGGAYLISVGVNLLLRAMDNFTIRVFVFSLLFLAIGGYLVTGGVLAVIDNRASRNSDYDPGDEDDSI